MLRRWFWNVLIALDQVGNALVMGDPDETISSRAAKARANGRPWGCVLCKVLDWVQPGHCDKALEPDEGADAVIHDGV